MTNTLHLQHAPTRLLLVEDDRLCLATLHSGLKGLGYEPVNATSGEEAIELCRRRDMDLAILDIGLPDMCGLELGRLLYETYRLPIIYLTGNNECDFIDKATRGGAFGYLLKPLEVERVAPAVEAALCKAGEMDALLEQKGHLQRALDQDRRVSICIGVIMERWHLGSEQAYALLRRHARSHRRKLADVASALITAMDEVNRLTRSLDRGTHRTKHQA